MFRERMNLKHEFTHSTRSAGSCALLPRFLGKPRGRIRQTGQPRALDSDRRACATRNPVYGELGVGSSPTKQRHQRAPLMVESSYHFDLESYASEYTGRTAILRLLEVAKGRQWRRHALLQAISIIKSDTLDYDLYDIVFAQLASVGNSTGTQVEVDEGVQVDPAPNDPTDEGMEVDTTGISVETSLEAKGERDDEWYQMTVEKARREGEKLEAEMRNYSINLIKESIRQTLLATARHQRQCGDNQAALKTYQKLRDYQSNAEQELEAFMATIEVALQERSYNIVLPTIVKAQHVLARLASSIANTFTNPNIGGGAPPGARPPPTVVTGEQLRERERRTKQVTELTAKTNAKLTVAKGVSLIATGQWTSGVKELITLQDRMEEWEGSIFSLSDVAIYASLGALATLSRAELKSEILDNREIRYNMDHGGAAYTRDLVEAFVGAKYKKVLEILEENKWRVLFDLHLQSQFQPLISSIKSRAYVQYLEPFQNVQLSRMATSFGISEGARSAFEREVVMLIKSRTLKARIDDVEKVRQRFSRVLYAVKPDKRKELYRDTLKNGKAIQESTRQAFLRMQLHQASVFIEDAQEKKKREQNARNKVKARDGDEDTPIYLDESDEEMLLTAQ
ncbi:hypothetical protein QFC19_004063 [Naganishia cerealis]|uniref:Uncharacterized protein n=1 Tax=Naganishia cerealis TaxID=610337 RepID=A0ACC2W041_9TREE|nr:hypothetical protein QFC19_004063 [Naganishia cerealis]